MNIKKCLVFEFVIPIIIIGTFLIIYSIFIFRHKEPKSMNREDAVNYAINWANSLKITEPRIYCTFMYSFKYKCNIMGDNIQKIQTIYCLNNGTCSTKDFK
jgi:hypothetical protein